MNGRRTQSHRMGLAWLHGALQAVVFDRQAPIASWIAAGPVETLDHFETAVQEAISTLGFSGSEAFLILAHDEFLHQMEAAPSFSEEAARSFLRARVGRHEQVHGRVAWVSQNASSNRQESTYIVHLLPAAFLDRLNQVLLSHRIELTRIVPMAVPLQLQIDAQVEYREQPVLIAAETGGATTILVGRGGGRPAFTRTFQASWTGEARRVGIEINRSILYAKQQLGSAVAQVRLLGEETATAEIRARCGADKVVATAPIDSSEWLGQVAALPVRFPVNLAAGRLKRRLRLRLIRTAAGIGLWLAVAFLGAALWADAQGARADRRRFAALAARENTMRAEADRLASRNRAAEKDQAFLLGAEARRLPPVAAKFLGYLAGGLPAEIRLTDFHAQRNPSSGQWTFRVAGTIDADEETARAILGTLQQRLEKGPFRAHFNDTGRREAATVTDSNGVARIGFDLGGGLFES